MPFRNCRKIAEGVLLLAVMMLFTACPTAPKTSPKVTPLTQVLSSQAIPPREPQMAQIPVEMVEVPAEPQVTPLREPYQIPAIYQGENGLKLPTGTLPLPVWCQLCGFEEVRIVQHTYPQTFELRALSGVLSLTIGQRFVKWNGVNLALGFTPALQEGQLALHSLDISKNLFPLAARTFSLPGTNRVLVIDPGHGGSNPGAKCALKNVWEKELTLDWALRIERRLAGSGWRVVLTRRQDQDIPLAERVSIADSYGADLFISLHFNSFETGARGREEHGLETYCLTPTGMSSNISREFEDDPAKLYPNNAFDEENLLLAARMQSSLLRVTGGKDRGVRRARFMSVLREQKRPAVLLEGGFLSNASEASLILQPSYRELLAQAVCEALPN